MAEVSSPNIHRCERCTADLLTGGVQNRIRKEGKDKPKDDGNTAGSASGGSKKDKKSSGLRGIRGLV